MQFNLDHKDTELLRFAFARAINAMHTDISHYTPVTGESDELRTKLVRLTNDLLALQGRLGL